MTQKNRTLEGKNRTLGGEGGLKIVENRRTSFMHVPQDQFLGLDFSYIETTLAIDQLCTATVNLQTRPIIL